MKKSPPNSITELNERAHSIAGYSLAEVAASLHISVPQNLRRHKGWVGQLLELYLGANAGSRAEPDFVELGVELKTIPIDPQGQPLESTYISICPLNHLTGLHWQHSAVCHKLAHVLWFPIEGQKSIPLKERRLGTPFLWQPDARQQQMLQQDWEELIEQIALGQVEQITAHQGQVLQLRPKAANRKALTTAIGPEGTRIQTLPRGFYLRPEFTKQLLKSHFE